MWARIVEFMLGCWLLISAYIFGYEADRTFLWINDLVCGGLILVFALISFHVRFYRAHLLTLLVALWLVGVGYLGYAPPPSPPPPGEYQNYIVLGLLLLMLAIVPSHAELPPRRWQEYFQEGD
jgi:peptidoglycan/LPS O-acetylase OafA/YrhL